MRTREWIPPAALPPPPACKWQPWNEPEVDTLSAVQLAAEDYRERSRLLAGDGPVEVFIPNWYARKLINTYGSLEAAVDSVFRPGAVRLVDAYWHEHSVRTRESVERQLTQFDFPRSDVDDLTRIALGAA